MTEKQYRAIWEKTQGHCHFCGDPLVFEKRGRSHTDQEGAWEADHVIQKGKGGSKSVDNCLPACTDCNKLRWHRHGAGLRELLLLGLIAKDETKKNSEVGKRILELKEKRLLKNLGRRKGARLT
jgi:5-methylcytosine-specific restriction endonuclease McrA